MRDLLHLDLVNGSCFSKHQIQELYMQLGLKLANISAEEQLEEIKRKLNSEGMSFDVFINRLMYAPATILLSASVLFDLRMSFRPVQISQFLKMEDIQNIMMRYVYWEEIVICGIGDLNENRLSEFWKDARWIVGFRKSENVWSIVLIDRIGKSVEFYDPQARTRIDTVVDSFFEAVKLLDGNIKVKSSKVSKPGFAALTPKKDSCGFACLEFMHSRIIEHKSFEDFLEIELPSCEVLRRKFFELDDSRFINKCTLEFPSQAYVVGKRYFIKNLEYLYIYINEVNVKQEIRDMLEFLETQTLDLNTSILKLQNRLMEIIPVAVVEYMGSDVWQRILEYICNDPFTKHLLKIKKHERNELINLINEDLNINFQEISKKEIYNIVYMLREASSQLIRNKKSTRLEYEYPYNSNLVKPLFAGNLLEFEKSLEKCDVIIDEALRLIQQGILIEIQGIQDTVDMVKINSICILHEMDILHNRFLINSKSSNRFHGWNFPLLKTSELLLELEPRFSNYACSPSELAALLEFRQFLAFLTIAVWIFLLTDHSKFELRIVVSCLKALEENGKSNITTHAVLCYLLKLIQYQPPDCDPANSALFLKETRTLYEMIITQK